MSNEPEPDQIDMMDEYELRDALRKVLTELNTRTDSKPEEETAYVESVCIESDGCPTELAVLQRFWRENSKPYRYADFFDMARDEALVISSGEDLFNAARERKEG